MIEYINKPKYWDLLESYSAERLYNPNKGSSFLYSRVEKINDCLYVGKRKEIDLYTTLSLY